jgi:hypothetical protein
LSVKEVREASSGALVGEIWWAGGVVWWQQI